MSDRPSYRILLLIGGQPYRLEAAVACHPVTSWRLIKLDGTPYLAGVDASGLHCSCKASEFHPEQSCKHLRALIATGLLPPTVDRRRNRCEAHPDR